MHIKLWEVLTAYSKMQWGFRTIVIDLTWPFSFKQVLNFVKSGDTQQLKTLKMSFQISVGKVDCSINDVRQWYGENICTATSYFTLKQIPNQ